MENHASLTDEGKRAQIKTSGLSAPPLILLTFDRHPNFFQVKQLPQNESLVLLYNPIFQTGLDTITDAGDLFIFVG